MNCVPLYAMDTAVHYVQQSLQNSNESILNLFGQRGTNMLNGHYHEYLDILLFVFLLGQCYSGEFSLKVSSYSGNCKSVNLRR